MCWAIAMIVANVLLAYYYYSCFASYIQSLQYVQYYNYWYALESSKSNEINSHSHNFIFKKTKTTQNFKKSEPKDEQRDHEYQFCLEQLITAGLWLRSI